MLVVHCEYCGKAFNAERDQNCPHCGAAMSGKGLELVAQAEKEKQELARQQLKDRRKARRTGRVLGVMSYLHNSVLFFVLMLMLLSVGMVALIAWIAVSLRP